MKKVVMLLSKDLESDARVCQEAKSLLKHKCDVTVVMWDRKNSQRKREIYECIKVDKVALPVPFKCPHLLLSIYLGLFNLTVFFRLLFMDFDVVHCHDFDTLFAGLFAAKLKGKKIVYDAHEIYSFMVQPHVPKIIIGMLCAIEFWLIKKVDVLITVNEILAGYFKNRIRDKSKVSIIMNYKDPDEFKLSKKEINEIKIKLGLKNYFTILYDGWLTPDNGLEELFSAIEKLDKQIGDIVAVICGDGYAEEAFKKEVKEKNIENHVKFVGKIKSKDIPIFVNACDVIYLVYKPTNEYSFLRTPVRLFEAIIAGKPVIASNFGNLRQIVENEGIGLIVDPEKTDELCRALLRVRRDYKLREKMIKRAKSVAKACNWLVMEKKLVQVYQHL